MNNVRFCKGCTGSISMDGPRVFLTDNALLDIEELWIQKRRLESCAQCEFLRNGTTCGQSGMLVSYRAGLLDAKCPHPAETKW